MKNKFLKSFLLPAFILALVSCSDFGDINIDPNNPSTPNTASLLTSALRGIPGLVSSTQPELNVQHLSEKYYTDGSRYVTVNFDYSGTYAGALADLQAIIDLNSDPETAPEQLKNGSNSDQIAVATILKSWYFWVLTDAWGDIPYSEALKGRANFRPVFDSQQSIYNSLFTELTNAVAALDESASIDGDIMYGGNLSKWKKFANSIRLSMALRLSQVDAAKGQQEFAAAFAAGVFESNSDAAVYTHLSDENNDNLWEDRFETRLDWTVSEPLVDYMKSTGDPRLPVYADPGDDTGEFRGMPYGLTQDLAGDIPNGQVSFLGSQVRQKTAPTSVMSYAQILFTLAEGAHRGWIGGGDAAAEQYYNDAIKASWQQYGVYDEATYNDFIAQPEVAYSAANAIEKIQYQKWVSLFLNGFEAWAEWRRTGYPALRPPANTIHPSGQIPLRYGYPTSERDLNGANYSAVVSKMGEDDIDVPVWWDK